MIAPLSVDPGECLIRVQAQVMAWDEKFSGWVPYEDGGVSYVSIYQKLRVVPPGVVERGVRPSRPSAVVAQPIEQPAPPRRASSRGGSVSDTAAAGDAASTPALNGFATRCDYVIQSCHVVDKRVLLNCTLTKDMTYRQVMPTFHHWQIGDEKYGLKFMSSYEACKFHNKLQKAVEHLCRQSKSSSGESNMETTSELEDDVFMPVTLPMNGNNNNQQQKQHRELLAKFRPLAETTARASPAIFLPYSPAVPAEAKVVVKALPGPGPSSVGLFGRPPEPPPPPPSSATSGPFGPGPGTISSISSPIRRYGSTSTSSIVRQPLISATIPMGLDESVEEVELEVIGMEPVYEKRSSIASVKIPGMLPLVPLKRPPTKRSASTSPGTSTRIARREQCAYCRQFYYVRDNARGSCPGAPDPCRTWIGRLTCLWLADRILYGCCPEPRSRDGRKYQRWSLLALMALLSPCLWCYPLLIGCVRCCRFCGCVDRRHKPAAATPTAHSGAVGRGGSPPQWSRSSKHSSFYR